jgi:hypothetical protein
VGRIDERTETGLELPTAEDLALDSSLGGRVEEILSTTLGHDSPAGIEGGVVRLVHRARGDEPGPQPEIHGERGAARDDAKADGPAAGGQRSRRTTIRWRSGIRNRSQATLAARPGRACIREPRRSNHWIGTTAIR